MNAIPHRSRAMLAAIITLFATLAQPASADPVAWVNLYMGT